MYEHTTKANQLPDFLLFPNPDVLKKTTLGVSRYVVVMQPWNAFDIKDIQPDATHLRWIIHDHST